MKVEKDRLKTVTKKVEEGKLFVETISHNDHVLENNQAHRNAGTITRGQKDNFSIDGAEVIHVIQAPEVDWMFFQRKYPQLYRGLHSKDRVIREASAAEIKRMYPEWFVEMPKKMFVGGVPRHQENDHAR